MNAQRKENIARAIIANRSTAQLCEMFEATNCTSRENLLEEMMVRVWIMDELEKRDAEAFERWIDCEENSNLWTCPAVSLLPPSPGPCPDSSG